MSIEILPLSPGESYYEVGTTIEGVPYTLVLFWNDRDQAWYLNIAEQDGTPIASGVKIVLGVYLGRRIQHALFRNGVLIAVDTSRTQTDAGFDDFGVRVILCYVPVLDLLARKAQISVSKKL